MNEFQITLDMDKWVNGYVVSVDEEGNKTIISEEVTILKTSMKSFVKDFEPIDKFRRTIP